jgi:hypothetical protein
MSVYCFGIKSRSLKVLEYITIEETRVTTAPPTATCMGLTAFVPEISVKFRVWVCTSDRSVYHVWV